MPPTECRVWGLFLVGDTVELTFDEIRVIFKLSKGTTSNALKTLQHSNNIEYITKLGDRKRYLDAKLIIVRRWQQKTFQSSMN